MGTIRRFFRGLRAEKAELWDVVPSGDLHAALALKPPKGGLDTRNGVLSNTVTSPKALINGNTMAESSSVYSESSLPPPLQLVSLCPFLLKTGLTISLIQSQGNHYFTRSKRQTDPY